MAGNSRLGRIFPNINIPGGGAKTMTGINLNDPMFAHLGRAGVGAMELQHGHNTSGPNRPMTDGNPKTKNDGKGGKAKWEQGAVKHPGVEKAKAKRNGISTHEQLERDAKSSDPTTAKRGRLGLQFEKQAAARKNK